MTQTASDAKAFWQGRYQSGETPWDLASPAPPFVAIVEAYPHCFNDKTVAVLGSGKGHDAGFFGASGAQVVGFDYVPEAVQLAQAEYGNYAQFVQADIFNLPQSYLGTFDWVVEHTCFCAIHPGLREAYVQVAYSLLKPGGQFLGLLWCHGEKGGPPYSTTEDQVRSLFSPYFDISRLAITSHSVERRKDEELLAVFIKR